MQSWISTQIWKASLGSTSHYVVGPVTPCVSKGTYAFLQHIHCHCKPKATSQKSCNNHARSCIRCLRFAWLDHGQSLWVHLWLLSSWIGLEGLGWAYTRTHGFRETCFCRGDHQCMGQSSSRQSDLCLSAWLCVSRVCMWPWNWCSIPQIFLIYGSLTETFTVLESIHMSQCNVVPITHQNG